MAVGSIWLWILDGNEAARSLYENLGFEVVGGPVGLKEFPGRWETRMTLNLSCPLAGTPASLVAAGVAAGPSEAVDLENLLLLDDGPSLIRGHCVGQLHSQELLGPAGALFQRCWRAKGE